MGKSASVEFDDNSLNVLKGVDKIHRDSIINIGLALVSKTHYYQTLTGKTPEEVQDVASLDSLDEAIKSAETKEETKKSAKSANSMFDDDEFF